MGRKEIYSEEKAKRAIEVIRLGNSNRAACRVAGISEDTLARWLKNKADFAEHFARAEAEAELEHVAAIKKAITRQVQKTKIKQVPLESGKMMKITEVTVYEEVDWRAAAFMLERRNPEDWQQRDRLDIGDATGVADAIRGIAEGIGKRLAKAPLTAPEITQGEDEDEE